jgi:hypothetical protein
MLSAPVSALVIRYLLEHDHLFTRHPPAVTQGYERYFPSA